MASRIEIKPITFIDIDRVVNWYEKEMKGLGNRFLKEIETTFKRIATNPESYLIVKGAVRRAIVKGFPYKVLFTIANDKTVVIFGVIHSKRGNRFIKFRIKSSG